MRSASSGFDVPVAVIVFNRPDMTRRLIEALSHARPRRLFVIADGPRSNVPKDREDCAETAAVTELGITWECDVSWNSAPDNLGCRARVESGLDWVFDHVDRAIVLEDDCIPDPSFFGFCAGMLSRFANDERIGSITGTNALAGTGTILPSTQATSYIFSRYPMSWGWATWRRAWLSHDPTLAAWQGLRESGWLTARLGSPAAVAYWRSVFDAAVSGHDAWDYGWTFTHWQQERLAIHPTRNLVTNVGFDARATHTRQASPFAKMPTSALSMPFKHPANVLRDAEYDAAMEECAFSQGRRGMLVRAHLAITNRRT